MTYDLDALFRATNASGFSAFNRVDRSMALLSKEMAGLILGHNLVVLTLTVKVKPVKKTLSLESLSMQDQHLLIHGPHW